MTLQITKAAEGRAKIYLWLSSFFINEPNRYSLERLLSPRSIQALLDLMPQSKNELAQLTQAESKLQEGKADEIISAFQNLFIVPSERTYVPPYESCFRERVGEAYGDLWGSTTLEVSASYQNAGFSAKMTSRIVAPDHIGLELAFMSTLCARRTQATAIRANGTLSENRGLQRLFLDQHLCQWLPAFAETISSKGATSFYASVSAIAVLFVMMDRHWALGEGA